MNIKHILLLVLISVIHYSDVFATIEIRSTHMTTNDGIANNSIRYMLQDSKGFIWMGTLNGLSRYDGDSFINFHPGDNDKISLSDHRIRSLYEDKNGFLWIAVFSERFSCYDLKKDCFVDFTGCGEYNQNYSDRMTTSTGDTWLWHEENGCRKVSYRNGKFSSITFKREKGNLNINKIKYIFEDERHGIWIGSEEGVAQVSGNKAITILSGHKAFTATSYANEVFFLSSDGSISSKKERQNIRFITQLHTSTRHETVSGTFRMGNDWYIFTSKGSYIFHLDSHTVSHRLDLNIKKAEVETDNKGNFWIHNSTGTVWYINAQTRKVKTFRLIPENKISYIDRERYYIIQDERGIIWISTYGNGLFALDSKTDKLQHFTFSINGFSHINSDFLQYMMEDRNGGIWISSEYTGVSRLSVLNEGAIRIFPKDETLSDRSNTIRMITRMPNDDIWVGTRQGGICEYDTALKVTKGKKYFSSNIYAAAKDAENNTWLGSRNDGLCIGQQWYKHSDNPLSISCNNIFTIYRDRKGRMWIGTFGGGLNLAIKKTKSYIFRSFFDKTYSQKQIRVVLEDKNGWIWIGTSEGVYIFQPDALIANPNNYVNYNYNNGNLRSNEVKCIFQDSKGYVWIGTSGSGFSRCMPKKDYKNLTFEHYDINDGLVNNMVQSIIEDKEGKLWIATEYGISRFSPETRTFENFFFSTYTLGNAYSENSACISKDGRLLFGTNYGLVVISPENVANNAIQNSEVAFTNLQVNGIYMRPEDTDSPLKSALTYANEINLKYFQNSFIINFTTFDYSDINNEKYSYRLDNYDKEWSKPSPLNFVAYKNLNPGTYTLHVKACSNSGKWSDKEAILKVIITPPFWKTTWAFIIYFIFLSIALYITFGLIRNFNNLRNKVQIEKQLTEYKLVFFTNISHEFRTPLTLIQGALEKMHKVGKIPKEAAYSLKVMDKSTQRMLRLINQLLEFRKMQNNKLALSLEETDIMAFLHEIFLCFKDIAVSKNIDFQFNISVSSYKMFIDKGNLDKVVYNLLSNAFKYTPSNGKITLSTIVDEDNKQIKISILDSGVGISKEKQGELFKRFMQSNFSGNSMGIGLHLAHELVNVHKGSITYSENENGGSIFNVTLPTDTAQYEEKDFLVPHNVLIEDEKQKAKSITQDANEENDTHPVIEPLNKYKVLIIEDDHDVRDFLKEELGTYFEITTESDGISGLKSARTNDIDLIISDILMPGITGYEVTRNLKDDFSTSHIPIILLTALSSAESHLEGVESGADAYITKPFSPKLLLARTFKLLEQREKLRKKFSEDPGMIPPVICSSDKDKQFVGKLSTILEQQIGNSQCSLDEIAETMGLGRTMFYRKVKGVTGYSPNEYIRIMRMKKAAELLVENKYNVAEVSYKVGIEDPFYFSKCFKKQFGVSPSAYAQGRSVAPAEKESI